MARIRRNTLIAKKSDSDNNVIQIWPKSVKSPLFSFYVCSACPLISLVLVTIPLGNTAFRLLYFEKYYNETGAQIHNSTYS